MQGAVQVPGYLGHRQPVEVAQRERGPVVRAEPVEHLAGTDPVALDAYVAKAYWNLEVSSLPYLKMAANRGLGTYEFEKVRTQIKTL